jgi:asparagine synthase (glutamine-hydrolysing)
MCGISGYFLTTTVETSPQRILRMTRVIAHRGPDDEGITLISPTSSSAIDLTTSDTAKGVPSNQSVESIQKVPHQIAFGHRRFSIVDVSPAGHQPFWSHNRQVCVIFNGEIYNYVELRAELKTIGHVFHTDSDTEVLVEAYLEWGVECFQRFNGFWAISLYDARKRAVLLARDRIGKAPLYVAKTAQGLFWSSEIKGIFAGTDSSAFGVSEQAVYNYVLYGWRDLFHKTFYEGITTFPNAAYAWIEPDGSYQTQKYWELPQRRLSESDIRPEEAIEKFRYLLTEAVRLRLRADVPVGVELSGGMDSSALVGLATQTETSIHAFTVSFPGTEFDEEPFARKVIEGYRDRIQYTVLQPSQDELFEQLDSYIWLLEEPFHSPNLLSNQGIWRAMAQSGIRVSINGAAGDELLAGYRSDYYLPYLRYLLGRKQLSKFLKEFFSLSEHQLGTLGLDYFRTAYHLLPKSLRIFRNPTTLIPQSIDPFINPLQAKSLAGPSEEIHQRLIDNMGDWRMNYWMRSGNKSSMGVPLEVRAPFLDYRVVDFAFTLPLGYLINNGWLKWILRETVKDILPSEVVWRKTKRGFPFPHAEWTAASKDRFFVVLETLECPYIDWPKLRLAYLELSQRDPLYLWRIMSLAFWWKKCVKGEPLL